MGIPSGIANPGFMVDQRSPSHDATQAVRRTLRRGKKAKQQTDSSESRRRQHSPSSGERKGAQLAPFYFNFCLGDNLA